jgi:tRNA G18 (ribose-2'-O)-methylase SpoU
MIDKGSMTPPIIKFSLPQFNNPRSMNVSGAFGLSVYSANV